MERQEDLEDVVRAHFGSTPVEVDASGGSTCQVTVRDPVEGDVDPGLLDSFPDVVSSTGWYVTQVDGLDPPSGDVVYTLHPVEGRSVPVPRYVYHTTSSDRVPQVLRQGLRLSRGGARHGFRYPPRVFFTQDPSLDGETMWPGPVTTLVVDTSKAPGIELFVDPQFDDGGDDWISAYATKPIPPAAVSVLPTSECATILTSMEHEESTLNEDDKSHPREYGAPEGSPRDKKLDKFTKMAKSSSAKVRKAAYAGRKRMEKTAREAPGWKNKPRPDTKKEGLEMDDVPSLNECIELIREMITEVLEEALSAKTKATLRKKAEKKGLTPGSVEAEYKKGLAAWATSGSRPGMSQHQWAMARVNAATPSKDWAVVKKSKAKKKK